MRCENRVRGTPSAIAFRAGLTRRAPGALGLSGPPIGYSVFKSRAAQPRLRACGTIGEHMLGVKRGWRDLLDKRSVGRYSRLRDCGEGLQCHRNGVCPLFLEGTCLRLVCSGWELSRCACRSIFPRQCLRSGSFLWSHHLAH